MPYNFEATFTKPLVAKLDAGEFKDAQDWANGITDLYIATIAQGLPNGVPPTLPAPGLNPTTPPPFPIGASGFTTGRTRKRLMYNLIYAYFFAKQMSIDKAQIQALTQSTKLLIERAKNLQKRIASTKEQIKAIEQEVRQLPVILKETYTEIGVLIQDQINDLDNLFTTIRTREYGSLTQQEFESLFLKEIRLYQRLKSFRFSNPDAIASLVRFVTDEFRENERLLASPKRDELIKRNLRNRLFALSKQALSLIQIPISPSTAIDFVRNLQRKSAKYTRLAERIYKLDLIYRVLRPQLLKLKAFVKKLINQLTTSVQEKLKRASDARKKKLEDRAERRQKSRAEQTYNKASSIVNKERKKGEELIKKANAFAKALFKILKKGGKLAAKIAAFVGSIIKEFAAIREKIIAFKARAVSVGERTIAGSDRLLSALQGASITPNQSAQAQQLSATLATTITEQQTIVQSGQTVSVSVEGGVAVNVASTAALTQQITNLEQKVQNAELEEVASYFVALGYKELVAEAEKIIRETGCTARDVKFFFEKGSDKYKEYKKEMFTLRNDLEDLQFEISVLFSTQAGRDKRQEERIQKRARRQRRRGERVAAKIKGGPTWIVEQITSLKSLLNVVKSLVLQPVDRTIQWLKTKYQSVKTWISKTVKKNLQKLENFALSLVPLKSEIKDVTNKKDLLEAKKKALADYKKTIQYWSKRLSVLRKVGLGSSQLIANLQNGEIGFVGNERAINLLLDGRYEYQTYDPDGNKITPERKKQLFEQLQKDKQDFGTLTIIETIVRLLKSVTDSLKQGATVNLKNQLFSDVEQLARQSDLKTLQSYSFVKSLIDAPPDKFSLNDLRKLANSGINSLLQDKRIVTKFVEFEKKNLRKTVQVFNSLLENQRVKERYESTKNKIGQGQAVPANFIGPTLPDTIPLTRSGTIYQEALTYLYKLRDGLAKNESFVLKAISYLSKIITKFLKWFDKTITSFIKRQRKAIDDRIRVERNKFATREREKAKKRINLEAAAMTFMFELAARVYWTGAQWVGQTGSQHTVGSIGAFLPKMDAKVENGATGFVGEMARGFESQLKLMQGFVLPPANTGILPIPFTGYT